jgi:N-methylhydantoinase A/oxoprolinase/acetone carboxylase beta subunit
MREANFDGVMRPTDVYSAERLSTGATVNGPAIIQAATTTILLDENDQLTVRPDGAFAIDLADK